MLQRLHRGIPGLVRSEWTIGVGGGKRENKNKEKKKKTGKKTWSEEILQVLTSSYYARLFYGGGSMSWGDTMDW